MEFEYRYAGSSAVESDARGTQMRFAPDLLRSPTYLRAELAAEHALSFREAMSALHDVVVSDLKWRPRARPEYQQWLTGREAYDLDLVAAQRADVAKRITALRDKLSEMDAQRRRRMQGFWEAQRRYYRYVYEHDKDVLLVLDPVVTVHPDEVFFECFSRDESSYGRLGVRYDAFSRLDEFSCGTTNVDYSEALYQEFQKIRRYKTTRLEVDPSGFATQTVSETTFSDAHKEVKIDLPESWVRGFLQVSSAMTLPAVARLELHPMDVHNLCFVLRRNREKRGPRALRYVLRPGEPVRVQFEPWGIEVECPRSRHDSETMQEIRVWGRRRLHVLERLVAVADSFQVVLLGSGLPSFYLAHIGPMTFTLGLSGWTSNDWSSASNFDLLAPRTQVDAETARRVFDALGEVWWSDAGSLARRLGLAERDVLGALSSWVQAGRVMYDLGRGVYRKRELSREPLPMSALRFANAREEQASVLVDAGGVDRVSAEGSPDGGLTLRGTVREKQRQHKVRALFDGDGRLLDAECDCNDFVVHRLRRGPCAHVLAVRLAHARRSRVRVD